jgi:hypothetical protein
MLATIPLREVRAALEGYDGLLVLPEIEADDDDGTVTITIRIQPDTAGQQIEALGLADAIRFVREVAQIRAFIAQYGIDPIRDSL